MGVRDPNSGLYFEERGPSEAASILFLHGGGAGRWMWQPQVERLSSYHCLVPDLPEHGDNMDIPFSIEGSAERMAELIRSRAHGGRAHVVGISAGAQVGLALLARWPELVERAALSGTLVRPLPGSFIQRPGLISASYRLFMAPLKNSEAWIRLNMKYSVAVPEAFYPQFKESFRKTTEQAFVNLMRENLAFRLPPGLERVASPVLVLVGRKEHKAIHDSARDITAAIPGARGYVVDLDRRLSRAAHHNWSLTAPQLFTQVIRVWIEKQPLPPALKELG